MYRHAFTNPVIDRLHQAVDYKRCYSYISGLRLDSCSFPSDNARQVAEDQAGSAGWCRHERLPRHVVSSPLIHLLQSIGVASCLRGRRRFARRATKNPPFHSQLLLNGAVDLSHALATITVSGVERRRR